MLFALFLEMEHARATTILSNRVTIDEIKHTRSRMVSDVSRCLLLAMLLVQIAKLPTSYLGNRLAANGCVQIRLLECFL
jgi:hypothetical protein